MSMNLRHAAALALVGWYLMVPPFDASGKKHDLDAPLAKWSQIGWFDTAKECDAQEAYNLKVFENLKECSDCSGMLLYQDQTAQCIQADDPRLKEK